MKTHYSSLHNSQGYSNMLITLYSMVMISGIFFIISKILTKYVQLALSSIFVW